MAEADVAVMIYSLQGGGAERMTLNLVDGFLKRGLKVDLVLCRVEGPYLASVPDDVRIIDCNARTSLELRGAVERYLSESPPRALLAMMEGAGVVALWARARARNLSGCRERAQRILPPHGGLVEPQGTLADALVRALVLSKGGRDHCGLSRCRR